MLRQWFRILAVAAVAAIALGSPAPAAAVTPVNACANLTKAGETYVLTADITSGLLCFLILADRITLDLAGHTITGPGTGGDGSVAVWDLDGVRTLTVVKNGSVTNFGVGMSLAASTRSTVRAVTASGNRFAGLEIGPTSLVKDCIVQRNLLFGIVTGDGVQVENCLIGGDDNGNGNSGLVGGQRMLVTRNTVIGNGNSGILVGMNSTVTHNTSNENVNDGIAVGQKSLVSYNTAADNGGDGIEAVCPSTITHNEVGPSGQENINIIGDDCFVKFNLLVGNADPQ